MEFDEILEMSGDSGKAQFALMLIVYALFSCAGWQQLISVFAARNVDFYCVDTNRSHYYVTDADDSPPFGYNITSDIYDNKCVEGCSEYKYRPGFSSINIDFDLDCGEKQNLKKFVHSAYWVGYLLGCMFSGYFGDRTGRRPTSVFTLGLGLSASLATVFCPNVELFLVFRVIVGFCQGGYFPLAFLVLAESVNKKYLGAAAMSCMALYAIGESLSSVTGYFFANSWKCQFITTTSVFGICFIMSFFFLPESPRWLYTHGKYTRAENILKRFARMNGKKSWETLQEERQALLQNSQQKSALFENQYTDDRTENQEDLNNGISSSTCEHTMSFQGHQQDNPGSKSTSFFALFGTARGGLVTCSQLFTWIGCAFIFYGFNYNAGQMGTNIYLTSLLMSVSELPAFFLFKLSDKIGRKMVVLLGLSFGTVASFVLVFGGKLLAPDYVIVATAIFAKFMLASALNTLYMFTPETFPTILRSSAFAYCSASQNVAVIVATIVVKTVAEPFVIFESVGILCTLFLGVFGRETLTIPLLNTLEAFHEFANNRNPGSSFDYQERMNRSNDVNEA